MKSKPNRDKATAPKLGLGWCKNCESAYQYWIEEWEVV